ncbi:MAG: sigma-70 family RNA polymerase sigma factor [Hymenobacteraceae bacterium]|nr:sigma-70 family RNA polymerase sigma factor [Hymenobacteraceae bacterium]MDX5394719.1 sigma-70 family RNA polymerase sigma factor [Hymenobacteraceae bacterium]MDX5442518.1 sigma-70 family RNA polymerase sigma factor [Hymenobacteraceae bacterium]MDX5510752.1 sigma-70 family RNA polymerase sigma factor [Hymenobacteraceae bacterium]
MKIRLYDTDEKLLAGLRNQEEPALTHLYKQHFPMILHFVLNNSGTEDDAKDIYQEAVIIFYEKIQDGTLTLSCQIKTYLYSVCRRLWLKRLAEKSRFSIDVDDSEAYLQLKEDQPVQEENELKFNLMAEAMAQLGEPCRQLLEDFYIQDLSMQDITDKFGYTSADSAKNQKYKCLQRLKKLFFANYRPTS